MIVAFDPGQTTGVAGFNGYGHNVIWVDEIFLPIEGDWDSDTLDNLDCYISKATLVIYESWRLLSSKAGALTGDSFIGPQVIGVIRAFCAMHNKPIQIQHPSQKGLITNKVLKALGITHSSPHIKDAGRHLALYLRNQKEKFVLDAIRSTLEI